jgi:hypothetical protein
MWYMQWGRLAVPVKTVGEKVRRTRPGKCSEHRQQEIDDIPARGKISVINGVFESSER